MPGKTKAPVNNPGKEIKDKLDAIGKTLKKAYVDTADWGKDNFAGITNPNTLLGATHQYRMWAAAFETTYKLFNTASGGPGLPGIPPSGAINQFPQPQMIPIIDKHFTTDNKTEIKYEIEMGMWAAKADYTKSVLLVSEVQEQDMYEISERHVAMMSSISTIKAALDAVGDEHLSYGNSSLIIGIGLLLLQSPKVLSEKDLTEVIDDIDVKLDVLRSVLTILDRAPRYDDAEIDSLLAEFMGMDLTDYIDNILTGRIFGLGETSSHTAALVNMAVMAEGLLAPCFNMINGSKQTMQAFNGAYASALDEASKLIARLDNLIIGTTRVVAKKAISIALKAIGISESIIDTIMGIKMQILALEKDAEKAIRGMEVTSVMAPPGLGDCPVTNLVSVHSLKAIAEAAIKNACLIPFMALANFIVKPILDALTDITSAIRSYQDMLGESLAAAYNLISLQRWVDYVMMHQLRQMRGMVAAQIFIYQEIKRDFIVLRRRITLPDSRMKMINRIFRAYITKLVRVSEEHDAVVGANMASFKKLSEGIKILQAISRLLVGRSPTDKDRKDIINAVKTYDRYNREESAKAYNIRESFKNLEGLWKEITDMRMDDFIGSAYIDFFDTYRVYGRIVKRIFGVDLNTLIDELQGLIEEEIGSLPESSIN